MTEQKAGWALIDEMLGLYAMGLISESEANRVIAEALDGVQWKERPAHGAMEEKGN